MILLDYIQQLDSFKGKRDRIVYALTQIVTGYPQEVLNKDLERLEGHIKDLERLRVEPKPIIVRLAVDASVTLSVGEVAKLNVEYTLADGTLVTDPVYVRASALFRDFDAIYNNAGFITSINLDGYKSADATYTITKTVNGFDVFDDCYTQGLHVVAVDDEFIVADINGESIGFTFTTDGKEETGDNWTIRVSLITDGTEFKSDNTSIVEVEDGFITGKAEGLSFVTVRNGELVYPVTVNVVKGANQPTPETPEVEPEEPITETPEPEEPTEPEQPVVDAVAPVIREVKLDSGTFDSATNTFTVSKDSVTTAITFEFDENVTVSEGAIVEMLPPGATDYVPYGTITAVDNIVTVTPIGANGNAGVEGEVLFRLNGTVTDAEGNEYVTELPKLVVTA